MDAADLNYHCPACGALAAFVIGDRQAFCSNNEDCHVLIFNPSLPDGGASRPTFIDMPAAFTDGNEETPEEVRLRAFMKLYDFLVPPPTEGDQP